MDVEARRNSEQRQEVTAAESKRIWVRPTIEDLGSVTEITLRGTQQGYDRTQRGSLVCCCAM